MNDRLNTARLILSRSARLMQSSRRRTLRRGAWLCFVGMLTLLVLLLTGCGTTSKLQAEPPQPVLMPALSQPLPTVDYSLQALRNIENWQQSVRAMFQTSEPL
jgi:hypothetical protein